MVDLSGKVVLITGASSGIGLQASVKLARMGAEVIMVARDEKRLDAAVAAVKERAGSKKVSRMLCDFSVQEDIKTLAAEVKRSHDKLHVLVDNAGLVSDTRRLTKDGIELTFAVNHLGYFILTNLLLDLLKASAPSRVVVVTSTTHRSGELDFDDLQMEKGYSIMRAYRRSKLANVLFMRELARRLSGSGVTVNAVHPGGVATNIWSKAPWYARPVIAVMKLSMMTPEEGGDTIVHLAAGDDVEGKTGGYYDKLEHAEPAPIARDAELAKKLWDASVKLCGGIGA